MARQATLTISVADMPAMKQLVHGLNTEVEHLCTVVDAYEGDREWLVESIKADRCECVRDETGNPEEQCERCARLEHLAEGVEMDARLQVSEPAPWPVDHPTLDCLLRQEAAK